MHEHSKMYILVLQYFSFTFVLHWQIPVIMLECLSTNVKGLKISLDGCVPVWDTTCNKELCSGGRLNTSDSVIMTKKQKQS